MSSDKQDSTQLLQSSICAGSGFPSPAQDYVEVGLNWNDYLVRHAAATFPVRVLGKSMEPLIMEGSYVIVDRSLEPKNGDIVVAIHREEFTLKRFVRDSKGVSLVPENSKFPIIHIQEGDQIEIWGVVTFSVQQHRNL